MNRRNEQKQTGYVNWPTGSPYENTGEGGLHVWLVILDEEDDFTQCCGPTAYLHSSDVHVPVDYTDTRQLYSGPNGMKVVDEDLLLDFEASDALYKELGGTITSTKYCAQENRIFPDLWDRTENTTWADRIQSAPLLACVCLGTTGGSWYNPESETEGYFCAKYENLSSEGKALYDLLQKLYNVSSDKMHLLTTLDT